MSFTISKAVNSMRVFIERKTHVTGRWDPHYYRPEFIQLDAQIRSRDHSELRELTTISTEQWDQKSLFSGDFPYIEISNIDLFLGRMGSPTLLPMEEAPSRAKMLVRPRDLLVSMTRPTRGAICFAEESRPFAVASNGFTVIRGINRDRIIPRYLYHVLRSSICLSQFDRNSSGGNYPAIAANAFNRVLIPLPDLDQQRVYSEQLDACYHKAEDDLAKATQLLDSIDDVLLEELGILRKPEPPNTRESRIFRTPFSELTGRRWDPNYAKQMGRFLTKFKGCKHPLRKLKDFVATVQYGISERATADEIGVPMLRMLNLQDGEWSLNDLKYIAMTDDEKKPYLVKKGDILFNRTNSKELVGKCNVIDFDGEYVFASYLMRVTLKADAEMLPEFLVAYMASSMGRIQIDAVSRQIAGMTNINAEEVRELQIPALGRKAQERVCGRVASIREHARSLREQARADLEKAKRDIEALILGKEAAE